MIKYLGMSLGLRALTVAGLTFALMGSASAAVEAAYIIKLNNGNEVVTGRFWQEGGQVLFDTYGGTFGIDKNFISKIEKTDGSLKLSTIENNLVRTVSRLSEATDTTGIKTEPPPEKRKETKDPVAAEFNRLKEKSLQVREMLTSEIQELLDQITAYKNKLTRDSKLFVEYGREFNEIREIGARVENALRSRTQ